MTLGLNLKLSEAAVMQISPRSYFQAEENSTEVGINLTSSRKSKIRMTGLQYGRKNGKRKGQESR